MKITKIGRLKITTRGWPWQGYGWNPLSVKDHGRFGGGWAIKFGFTASKSLNDVVIDLIIGSIRISWE